MVNIFPTYLALSSLHDDAYSIRKFLATVFY